MNAAVVQRLARLDMIYGIAAIVLLLTGIARLVWGVKGMGGYVASPLFHIKMTLFVIAVLLSLKPTFTFRRWKKALDATGQLPAGRYDAVRLDIGTRRAGRNWWCVLYPGLCRSACGGYDTPAENDLVCGEYIVRFRFVEWWGGLTAPREDVVLAG